MINKYCHIISYVYIDFVQTLLCDKSLMITKPRQGDFQKI